MGRHGRTTITVRREPDHAERLAEFAARAAADYAREFGIDLDETLVIGPSTSADGVGAQGEPHTASPVLGYLRAMDGVRHDEDDHPHDHPLDRAYDQFLFVSVGAGPSAACALYRPEGR